MVSTADFDPEWILSTSTDSNAAYYSPNFLSFTIVLSILFHLGLAFHFIDSDNMPFIKPALTQQTHSFKVQLVSTTASTNKQKQMPLEKMEIVNPLVKPRVAIKNPPIINTASTQIIDKVEQIEDTAISKIHFQNIFDNIEQYSDSTKNSSNTSSSESVIFNPTLRKKLIALTEQKNSRRESLKQFQLRADNEQFEFNLVGGLQMIRVNGMCFYRPKYEPFALTQKNWTIVGKCKKR